MLSPSALENGGCNDEEAEEEELDEQAADNQAFAVFLFL